MSLTEVDWSAIPAPEDDGAAAHLEGMALPAVALPATSGGTVDASRLEGRVVLYVYPRTGRPGRALPEGWNEIPGARGCTPQTCAFRDHFRELRAAGADHVFGLSTQDTEYQREAAARLDLPFPLLSDVDHLFGAALRLPSFEVEGALLWKRLALIAEAGRIVKVFYPVFPPDRNARDVLDWLTYRQGGGLALEGISRP
ncbi:peroxiredoxin [Rhodosalinus sp. K401]|uniref:peroxiredoxin n=1 Tax=Rhodosalinus sp. K401 TaxID=3239195 RepID=UPI0035254B03